VHEKVSCGGWVFEVLVIEGRRIDKVNAMQADNQALI
jgi:CBS domain containing-hemolysin-like protein